MPYTIFAPTAGTIAEILDVFGLKTLVSALLACFMYEPWRVVKFQ
jgi:hypothetical protein